MKLTLALAAAVVCTVSVGAEAQTLKTIQARGVLNCGTGANLAGFAVPDANGILTGINADYCRALAAAVFGDQTKVKFIQLPSKDRITALQSGETDLIAATTTWTMSRDTTLGQNF